MPQEWSTDDIFFFFISIISFIYTDHFSSTDHSTPNLGRENAAKTVDQGHRELVWQLPRQHSDRAPQPGDEGLFCQGYFVTRQQPTHFSPHQHEFIAVIKNSSQGILKNIFLMQTFRVLLSMTWHGNDWPNRGPVRFIFPFFSRHVWFSCCWRVSRVLSGAVRTAVNDLRR